MNDDCNPLETQRGLRVQMCAQRPLILLSSAAALALLVNCGGSAPKAQSPAQPNPERTHEPQSSAPDATFDDGVRSETPAEEAAPPMSGEPSPEDQLQEEDEAEANTRPKARSGGLERYDLPDALAALERYDAKLSATFELSAPDCTQAEIYRRAVCQLAERICTLEQALPSTVGERHCDDSRERCVAATTRYKQRCAP